jgi:nitronate monooxygenase
MLRATVREIRQLTPGPFNVNLFDPRTEVYDQTAEPGAGMRALLARYHAELGLGTVPAPQGLFGSAVEQLEVLIEEEVPVVSFHFGAERALVERAQRSGARVLCSATTVAEAKVLEDLGVDAIIAQGGEAGGHRGSFLGAHGDDQRPALVGTMALVPRVVDAVSVPVIAAGGIMDARGVVAALALGASAVQLGTAFLGCPEAPISEVWRSALEAAEAESTTVTEAISGRAARGLRTRFIEEVEALEEPLLPYPAQYAVSSDLRREATRRGDPRFMAMWAGQGVGLFTRKPAAELVRSLVAESRRLMARLGDGATREGRTPRE